MVGITELSILFLVGLVLVIVVGAAIVLIIRKQQFPTSAGETCSNCGHTNPQGNSYCGNCGKPL